MPVVIRDKERTFFIVNSFNNVLTKVAGNAVLHFPPKELYRFSKI